MIAALAAMVSCMAASGAVSGGPGIGTVFHAHGDRSNPNPSLACFPGKVLDDRARVVAHKTLACGTRVFVVNPRTGRWTMAVVADRGPAWADIDLSRATARAIGHSGLEVVYYYGVQDRRCVSLALEERRAGHCWPTSKHKRRVPDS